MESPEKICEITLERMQEISAYIRDQMDKGLRGEPSDLQMLPSFVDDVCTGMFISMKGKLQEKSKVL